MVDRVTFTTDDSGALSPEQQAAEAAGNLVADTPAIPVDAVPDTATERPDYVPEKFWNEGQVDLEGLSKSYTELESKLSSPKEEAPAEAGDSNLAALIDSYSTEYYSNGEQLSEDQYKSLADSGLSKEVVDHFIQGQEALRQSRANEVMSSIGGEEAYKGMMEWAGTNLSEAEVTAYNEAVGSADQGSVLMAVKGLHARYAADVGPTPTLVQGEVSGSSTSSFQSTAELTAAMKDPRYSNDPAYRASVMQRLSVSKAI